MPAQTSNNHIVSLASPVNVIKGIGPKKADAFKKLGVENLEDLLYLLPRRYEDRREPVPLNELEEGEYNCAIATVMNLTWGDGRTNAIISDGYSEAKITWFSEKLSYVVKAGMRLALYGMVDYYGGGFRFTHPKFEILRYREQPSSLIGRIFPVYPANSDLSQRDISDAVEYVLMNYPYLLRDFLPEKIIIHHNLMSYANAIKTMHFPKDEGSFKQARNRLAFDELFLLQTGIFMRRSLYTKSGAKVLKPGNLYNKFVKSLPYEMTRAQRHAIAEIFDDLNNIKPMNRLLQGDVGSGKTLVAICAMLAAVDSKTQAVFLAPTEILAQQHFINITKFLEPFGVKIALHTGSTKTRERKKIINGLIDGKINILIGTHAVLSDDIILKSPGIFIIDEQHRFGVLQRNALISKSEAPHVLAMTATPIPRTLISSIYSDLDVSVLDEMPPGRKPVETIAMLPVEYSLLPSFIRARIKLKEQVYWVCPLIEEGERDLSNVTKTYDRLRNLLPEIKIAMLHGRLGINEKSQIMREFTAGEIDLLVSTLVIEVGVDVPNATLMIIQDADQFGLAQLHQLRGRIGRGKAKSTCILVESNNITEEGSQRILAMLECSDGFQLSERDLIQRGPGVLCGTRQHGVTDFRVADLLKDKRILNIARHDAEVLIKSDPELKNFPELKSELMRRLGSSLELVTVS